MRPLMIFLAALPAICAEFDHSRWDAILKTLVNDRGEVNYTALRRDHKMMDLYIADLGASSPVNKPAMFPSRDHELAYWINAYNAFVTWGVASRPPVSSVREIDSFFKTKNFVAGGVKLSADDIEHEIIRQRYKDPRVHAALVCASLGCPYLSREAYYGSHLPAQLDRAVRHFLSQERNLAVDGRSKTITLSKIFEWYAADFEGSKGLMQFLLRHANEKSRRDLMDIDEPRFRYREYDWRLNQPGSRKIP